MAHADSHTCRRHSRPCCSPEVGPGQGSEGRPGPPARRPCPRPHRRRCRRRRGQPCTTPLRLAPAAGGRPGHACGHTSTCGCGVREGTGKAQGRTTTQRRATTPTRGCPARPSNTHSPPCVQPSVRSLPPPPSSGETSGRLVYACERVCVLVKVCAIVRGRECGCVSVCVRGFLISVCVGGRMRVRVRVGKRVCACVEVGVRPRHAL
jgi:hypothetical protein